MKAPRAHTRVHWISPGFALPRPLSAQGAHELATITQLKSAHWRVQVKRKQSYASETFPRHEDARKWTIATERRIDPGEAPRKSAAGNPTLFAHLVDLHVQDMWG